MVVARPLHDGSMAIGLFNRGEQEQAVTVNWNAAGLKGKKLHARDLWKHADVKISGDSYTATVPSHAVVLLKVK